jgi:secreted PhoX family phosphatase
MRSSTAPPSEHDGTEKPSQTSRRDFFKKAAVGAVAVTGTAELAKVTASSLTDDNAQTLYAKDIAAGDRVLAERDYVLMSDQEKKAMIQGFVDDYHGNG